MHLILLSDNPATGKTYRVQGTYLWMALFSLSILLVSIGAYAVMQLTDFHNSSKLDTLSSWNDEISLQNRTLQQMQQSVQQEINSIAIRVGSMQAQVDKLDAIGKKIVMQHDLQGGEFDFESTSPVGGPHSPQLNIDQDITELLQQINQFSQTLENRKQQLTLLESVILSRQVDEEITPQGRPIIEGWISSRFGIRDDPFTGKPDFHKGIDLAGKDGSPIIAVAAGVVMWSGKRYGYGNMVEINHGNGYITRYGHTKENLVEVGDTVAKGDKIALMGTSGRSTGPHVHYEVIKHGKTVNPIKYITTASN